MVVWGGVYGQACYGFECHFACLVVVADVRAVGESDNGVGGVGGGGGIAVGGLPA